MTDNPPLRTLTERIDEAARSTSAGNIYGADRKELAIELLTEAYDAYDEGAHEDGDRLTAMAQVYATLATAYPQEQ